MTPAGLWNCGSTTSPRHVFPVLSLCRLTHPWREQKYRWLDAVSCVVVPGEARVVVQSFSTNVCPTGPLVARLCRPLCGWVTVFSDGGQNRQHILQLARTLYANGVELRVEVRSSSDSFKGPLALTDKKTQ